MTAESPHDDAPRESDADPAAFAVATQLLEGMGGAALLFTRDGRLCAANREARTRFVIDDRAPLRSQRDTVVLSTVAPLAGGLLARVREGQVPVVDTCQVESTGQWLELRLVPCEGDLLLVSATDVTVRETQRVSLERAQRETDSLLGILPLSVRMGDLAGRIIHMNARAQAEHDEPRPATLRELWERDQPRRTEGDVRLAFLETAGMRALAGRSTQGELTVVRRGPDATVRVIEVDAAPMLDESGRVTGLILVDRDVTDRRPVAPAGVPAVVPSLVPAVVTPMASAPAAERESALTARMAADEQRIAQLVEERARALTAHDESTARDRRLAAIGRLAAGVIHDVNNVLNPIMAAAFLLRHHAESPDAVRDYADRIRMAAETGAATASRVGRFIRQEPTPPGTDEVLDLSVVAEEVLVLTEPPTPPQATDSTAVRVVRDYGAQVLMRGIPGEIREMLLNLVSNARDAMPKGGTIRVTTKVVGEDAQLIVRDDGVGMTEEVRERAIEPFFTTKGAKGTGLGLAEAYGIARRHRGTLTIDSAPGAGTAVTLRFPVERGAVTPTATGAVPASGAPVHILVVEDHDDGREFLCRIVRAAGHTADAVATCAEARERLSAPTGSSYDLMLTDVGLPDGSGWGLVTYARERLPKLRIGVLTGWEPRDSGQTSAGAEFVLRKPLRAAELLSHIGGRTAPDLLG